MKKALSYILIFVGIQIVGGALVPAVWRLFVGSADMTPAILITSSVVVSVVTIAVFLWARWTEVSATWLRTRPWGVLAWSVVASLGALIPLMWLEEFLPDLPNWMDSQFDMILADRWGYLAVGLLAPLSEEIVMRGAVLRILLDARFSAAAAILLSAFFFALIHFNPAQMPHAFLVGILLGWMYWRTGSILPGVAYHWANNTVAYVLYQFYPDSNMKLIDFFQGSQQHVVQAVVCSLLILLPALYQLHLWMRRAE